MGSKRMRLSVTHLFVATLLIALSLRNILPSFQAMSKETDTNDTPSLISSLSPAGRGDGGEERSQKHPSAILVKQQQQRPKLRDVINFTSQQIVGDPSFLLDFAIIGFPKCGTTALQSWMENDTAIAMLPGEDFQLSNQRVEQFVWKLYLKLPAASSSSSSSAQLLPVRRGYKNPLDIRVPHTLDYLGKYFPKTLLVIGLRHPVDWFQSMYNFKIQNLPAHVHPSVWGDPNTLIDKCIHWTEMDCVGTAKAWFHVHLATLGKVSFPDSWKVEYPLYLNATRQQQQSRTLPNPIFLYETRQLKSLIHSPSKSSSSYHDNNTTRTNNHSLATQFRNDLAKLLHLHHDKDNNNNNTASSSLSSGHVAFQHAMIPIKPDMTSFSKRAQKLKNQYKIQTMCDAKYQTIRIELMRLARQASPWIRNILVQHPDVHLSSPTYFDKLLQDWMKDPCVNNNKKK